MRSPAEAMRTEPAVAQQPRNVYFMARHWEILQNYHRELREEISALTSASKVWGIKKEVDLKQVKLAALELLQGVQSYQQLEVLIKRSHLDKGVRSGKRFKAIWETLEVYAYHDDLDTFDDQHYQRLPTPYLSFRETAMQSRNTDASPLSDYLNEAEKAEIIRLRDDLQCAVNEFDHRLYVLEKKNKSPKLTTHFLKDRAFKRLQIGALNELLLNAQSRESLAEYVDTIIYRFQHLEYALGDFNATLCVGLLDKLLKHKEFYFSFKEYYDIHQLRTDLQNALGDLRINHTPAWLEVTSEAYKAEWIQKEIRIKTIKLITLDNLLKIDNLVALQRFILDLRSDPDALKGHPSRVKHLLESLEVRHLQNAMHEPARPVQHVDSPDRLFATRYLQARQDKNNAAFRPSP